MGIVWRAIALFLLEEVHFGCQMPFLLTLAIEVADNLHPSDLGKVLLYTYINAQNGNIEVYEVAGAG